MADAGAFPVFDAAAFERQTGGDTDLRHEIIGMFLEDCPVRVAAVHAAVEQGDAPALASAAHMLHGILRLPLGRRRARTGGATSKRSDVHGRLEEA